ncbi:MAG: DUF378 domain-containing protein [Erysipelotrichaceae bacterium]|nr:DUF378 domain-containing protein [Erysipelotrichaceae bacterium]MBQ4343773.1 DUF378 domain-containing protein [Erysipelotrichaceae bacterium]
MKMIDMAALLIGVIGCINWGLIGIANFNLVEFLFGSIPFLVMIVYLLVGISGVYLLTFFSKIQ